MIQIAIILITALVFSTISTLLARWVALRVGVVSMPRTRDIHLTPVPLLGGAAIYVAFVVALLIFNDRTYLRELFGILAGATLIALVGLVDDRWGLRADLKMLGQLGAGAILLLGGTQIQLFAQPWLNWGITLFWVVGLTNAINFLDNMDGLSGGVATIASAFFLLLAAMNEPRQVLVGAMAAALMGACAGFLRYNLSPTKIFMGDAGSLFIGFILAALAIKLRFPSNIPLVTWMVPVCVLALPIFDTTLVFVARLRRRVNPFTTAGKDHLSHRLVALGMTRREAVLTCYLLTGACGLVGIYMTQARLYEAYIVAGALAGGGLAALIWLERSCPGGVRRPLPNRMHSSHEA
jgi:UDP-GlcNAc:undecaprenyl-phosphate GlcNAc-1-phosphate transferase